MDKRSDRRMQIIFDLDNVLLEEIEKGSRKTIYTNIKKFMTKNGFDHIEYSGYVSKEPMKVAEVLDVVRSLKKEFPILDDVVEEMHVTEVGNTYSLDNLFRYKGLGSRK